MTRPKRILIIEDDRDIVATIAEIVQSLDHEPVVMRSLPDGLEAAKLAPFPVIVLDRMLPGGDGVDAIARLRAQGCDALILVVSALGRAENRIEGLDRGADDYLAKPFDGEELRARIRALLRRREAGATDNDMMVFGDLQIRLKARTLHVGQVHVALSPREFDLVSYLGRNAGQIVTRMQLLENVWNLHFDPQTNVVDVHIGRLRRKLEAAAARSWIETRRGEGYVFLPEMAG